MLSCSSNSSSAIPPGFIIPVNAISSYLYINKKLTRQNINITSTYTEQFDYKLSILQNLFKGEYGVI